MQSVNSHTGQLADSKFLKPHFSEVNI